MDSSDKYYKLRHTATHVMAEAVGELFPGVKYAIGPPIDDGFYYDFELPRPISEEGSALRCCSDAKLASSYLPTWGHFR